jgi:hypothetical protein
VAGRLGDDDPRTTLGVYSHLQAAGRLSGSDAAADLQA